MGVLKADLHTVAYMHAVFHSHSSEIIRFLIGQLSSSTWYVMHKVIKIKLKVVCNCQGFTGGYGVLLWHCLTLESSILVALYCHLVSDVRLP